MNRPNKFLLPYIVAATVLAGPFNAAAEAISSVAIEPLDNIRQAAENFAASLSDPTLATQVTVGNLDPRLRLAACGEALQAFSPTRANSMGRTTVGVRCHAPSAWTIYVPVTLSAYTDVIALRVPLQRGDVLTAENIQLTRANVGELTQGYFLSVDDIVGKQAKRNLRAGDILTPNAIQSARLVNSGDIVTLIANTGTLSVKMQGQALRNGAVGDIVDVRNNSSKRVVRGKVTGAGVVEIMR